jgi:hypothetical protein
MSELYVKGIAVRDTKRKGMKFNRNEEQQCTCCEIWKPFVRKYWVTSMYVVCRRCLYQLESNVSPSKVRRYNQRHDDLPN